MVSSSRKKMLKQDERPHFFKIVLSNSISHHKLAIPRKFVQMYGDVLSSPLKLKVPISDSKWKVEIVRSEGDIWLQKGWREFAEYYSVVEGSFLVFEYQKKDSEFNVIIFDKTASEIDYPVDKYSPTGRQRVGKAVHKESSNVQSENPSFKIVMEPSLLYTRMTLVIPPSFARNYLNKNDVAVLKDFDGRTWFVNYYSRNIFGITKTRIERFGWKKFVKDNHLEVGDVCVFELIDHVQTTFRVAISKYPQEANLGTSLGNRMESIEKQSRSKERGVSFANCCEAKEAPKKITSVNPSFQATISSACLRSSVVYVPASFIKNIKQETKYAKLKLNNRCWPVKLIIHPKFCSGQLSAGWSEFARKNSLKAGDVCIFELINSNDQTLLIKVSIVRDSGRCSVSNRADIEVDLKEPKVEETTFEIPDEDIGQFSSSRKRKEKSTLSSSHPRKKMKNVVNFTKKTGKEVKKENEGLAYQKHMVNKILIKKKPYVTLEENTLDENPTFQMAILRSHVHRKWSMLDIPARFSRKYMKRNDGNVVLNVLGGETWSAKYCRRQICGITRTKLIHSDWKKFVQGNCLRVGDTCTFELMDPGNSIFQVIISKGREATNLGKTKQSMRKECICLQKPSSSKLPEAGKKYTAVNPIFQVVMTPSHLEGGGTVHVPRKFIKNLVPVTRIAQLQVEDRIWSVKMIVYPEHGEKSMFSGWVRFARENSLKVGDVCSFELIDTRNLLIKVSILRQ